MDLNDKIKKQEIIIEELNDGVDSLITEWVSGAFTLLRKIGGKIPSKTYKKLFKKISNSLEDDEKELQALKDEDATLSAIEDLVKKIETLNRLASDLEKKKEEGLLYKKIVIEFKKKIELDIQVMKSPEFQRNLDSTMYFKVMEINEDEKYLILKTKGYSKIDDSLFFKLEYKKLETFSDQKGDINLIYSKYKNPNINPVEGDKEDCFFKIVELK